MEFISRMRPDNKRNDIKKWMKYGHLKVNGIVTSAFDTPVNPGDEVQFNASRPFPSFHHHRIEIVYEDADVIVINKGYGLLSVATQNNNPEVNA